MKKCLKILLTFVLVIALVVAHIPIAAAEDIASTNYENAANQEIVKQENVKNTDAYILGEITEKREANKKVFRLSDGTYMFAEYPQQIHFKENGKWKDYDNTLIEEKSEETSNTELVNNKSDIKISLSKKINGKKIVQIKKDGYKISWYYVDAKKSTATIKEEKQVSYDKSFLNKLTSTVLYKNVYENIDLEYVVLPTALKENIILKTNTAQTEFEAEYKSNGLTPQQIDDQTIILTSEEGNTIYTISAPYMEDSKGAYCENVSIKLENVKANKFSVIISLDEDWLLEEERAYPILVDPVLKTSQDKNAAKSAFVASANPNKCYLASGTDEMGSLYVGNISGFGQTESYIKFTSLPSLEIADKVIDARVYLALRKCEIGLTVNVKQLFNDWDPYTVNWNNRPISNNIIKDYMFLTPETDTSQFQSVEITDLVRGWYSGEYANYGISLSTDKTTSSKAWFYSIHYTGYTAARPIMTVTYRNMSGYEDYWSYTSIDAGRSGTASVNNYNGNFIFSQPITLDCGGNLMPVELSLVYNSNADMVPYTHFHYGIQTNYHIFIRYDEKNAENGYKYYLNDADGTRHWFYFENGSTSGKDENGLGYTLYEISEGSESEEPNAHYKLCDTDGNIMLFDSYGNILRITNTSGISATVQYEVVTDTRRIKSITDGAGRVYSFQYSVDSAGLCVGITDPAGRSIEFGYDYGLYMWLFFPDGKTVYMSRDSSDWLVNEIIGIDNNRIDIIYDNTAQHRVNELKSGTNTSTLEKYTFSYKQNETTVCDKQNRKYTYQFNDYGQTTGIVSNTDGKAQFFEYSPNGNVSSTANKILSQSKVISTVTNYVINPGFTRELNDAYWTYIPDKTGDPSIYLDYDKGNFSKVSLKTYKPTHTTGNVLTVQDVSNVGVGTYTLSGYIDTQGQALQGNGAYFGIIINDSDGLYKREYTAEKVLKTDGWERLSVTFAVNQYERVQIAIGFVGYGTGGTVWFDDLQFEKGVGESSFNLIENPSALNGITGWNPEVIVGNGNDLAEYPNYFYRNGDTTDRWLGISQAMFTNSKEGEVYTFGAWVKANSVPTNNGTRADDTPQPACAISLNYYDSDGSWKGNKCIEINPDVANWQFVSGELILPQDTPKICLEVMYFYNANRIAVTGAFCYKEEFGQTYTYDNNGNVISSVDLANINSSFAYYGNQMSQMLNPSGSRYLYNYNDNKQLYSALSSSGQEYSFTYDAKGNLTSSEITARKPVTVLETGKKYVIVNAFSGLAIDSNWRGNIEDDTTTYRFAPSTSYQQWKLDLTGDGENIYSFKASSFDDRYLDVCGGSDAVGTKLQIFYFNGTNAQKFKPVLQSDNTFVIYTAVSNYTKVLDGQYDNPTEVKLSQTVKQAYCNISNLKASQRWYFYPAEEQSSEKIVTTSEYTQSGNFVSKTVDARGNSTYYNYNEQDGTLTNTTDTNGNTTSYIYDENTNNVLSVASGGITVGYSYENDHLKSIATSGNTYGFTYDEHGRRTEIKIGSRLLSSTIYSNNLVSQQNYGNGNYIKYTYDNLDRVISKEYNGNINNSVKYFYGNTGLVSNIIDYFKNTRTKYIYDLANRIVGVREFFGTELNGNTLISSVKYNYEDKTNRLSSVVRNSALGTQEIGYVYGNLAIQQNPDAVYTVKQNGIPMLNYIYDSLGRLYTRTIAPINKTASYTYVSGGHGENSTTALVDSVIQNGIITSYTYDANGNITEVKKNGETAEIYTYDSLNRLKTVTRNGVTTEYSYSGGNITEVKQNGVIIKSYAYGDSEWKDLLTEYNGQGITYDGVGNPLFYRGKTLNWQNGRKLAGITENGNTIVYSYDADGNRTSKTVNGITTEYVIIDGTFTGQIKGEEKIAFLYDESGAKYGFTYNGATYYYNLNLQGDVIGIFDSTGAEIVQYTYDEWGKPLSVTGALANTIGQINPIRYRGYYYDTETGFYLTGTRYYDPEIGRFINADGYVSTGQGILGNNMFAYCGNNPVNRADPTGMFWKEIGDFFSKAWNGIKTWAKNTFGAGSSTTATIAEIETPVIPDPSPITVKTGTKTTQTISKHGDSSKPISVYANKDAQHPIKSSSAGININIVNFTLDLSVGLDDIGVSGSLTNGNTTNSFGVKLNLSELKIGFEGSTAIQWDNTTETAYTNASISGWAIAAAYILATTGQYVQSPSYAY